MKHWSAIGMSFLVSVLLIVFFTACGGGETETGNAGNASNDTANTESKEVKEEKKVSEESQEEVDLEVNFTDQEMHNPGVFELKKSFAFISGMSYNGKTVAKLVYIAFANYEDAKLGYLAVDMPKEEGQVIIILSFKTESVEVTLKEQMETYNKLQVPTGDFQPTWMGQEQCFQVNYFIGPNLGGPAISGDGASGTATLSVSTPEQVKGTIDFTSPKGSTIKGSFDLSIMKDLWKK